MRMIWARLNILSGNPLFKDRAAMTQVGITEIALTTLLFCADRA